MATTLNVQAVMNAMEIHGKNADYDTIMAYVKNKYPQLKIKRQGYGPVARIAKRMLAEREKAPLRPQNRLQGVLNGSLGVTPSEHAETPPRGQSGPANGSPADNLETLPVTLVELQTLKRLVQRCGAPTLRSLIKVVSAD